MNSYVVIITPDAKKQINEIADYIYFQLSNPSAMYHFLYMIEEKTTKLETFPYAFPLVNQECWNKLGLRKVTIQSFIIYYFVSEETRRVYIVAVINSKRDQLEQLKKIIA